MSNNHSFLNLVALQFREFIREPDVLFWGVFFPVILSGVLGLAFANQGETTSRVGIITNQYIKNNPSIKKLTAEAGDSASFDFIQLPVQEAFLRLKRGEISLIVEPEAANALTYHFDPQNADAELHYLQLEKKLHSLANPPTVIKPVTTQGSRYIDFLIPGMIALNLMNSCIWGIGWGLIELRIKKLLRRMVATPMSKAEFLLSHFVSRLSLTIVETVCLLIFAYYLFNVQISGSLLALSTVFLAGNVAFGGIAMLVAARPQKTQVGNGVINFITLSMTILSGIFFSYTNFPGWAANIIQFLPLTLLADALRSVFNEGAAFVQIADELLILTAYGVVGFVAGIRFFKWY